jgi:hypothetical protein
MNDKPKSLNIIAENGRLVGTDETGREWVIRWCGNGQYSHWVLHLKTEDLWQGWYVFIFDKSELKQQIEAAEKKYGVYS